MSTPRSEPCTAMRKRYICSWICGENEISWVYFCLHSLRILLTNCDCCDEVQPHRAVAEELNHLPQTSSLTENCSVHNCTSASESIVYQGSLRDPKVNTADTFLYHQAYQQHLLWYVQCHRNDCHGNVQSDIIFPMTPKKQSDLTARWIGFK